MGYADLLEVAKRNPAEANFQKLRLAFARSKYYRPYEFDMVAHKSLSKALDKNDLPIAVAAIRRLLTKCYLDIHAHMLAVDVYARIGDQAKETYHFKLATGLLDSILQSGDGRSYQTAFIVISTQEEYALLRVLGLEPIMQSLKEIEGHQYDVFELSHPKTGKILEIYFNIDLPVDWLDRQMKGFNLKEGEKQPFALDEQDRAEM